VRYTRSDRWRPRTASFVFLVLLLGAVTILMERDRPLKVEAANGCAAASFAAAAPFPVGVEPLSVALGDLNGDGRVDLAVANGVGNSVSVLLNTTTPGAATPSFAVQQAFPGG
jgi:hypothetical protein